MSSQSNDLRVRERVEAALRVHALEAPGTPISITALCALASVNRASLYVHHRDLIQEVQNSAKRTKRNRAATGSMTATTVSELKRKLADERRRTNALYYLCIELQAEVRRLEVRAKRR
jgi:hypothetical protein